VCNRQDLGREHGILQYVTIMLDVYQVCHSVGRGVVLMKHSSELWPNNSPEFNSTDYEIQGVV